MAINKVILLGNVGQDPKFNPTNSGGEIATFSLATTDKWKDKNGEWQAKTEWHKIVVYNSNLVNIVHKLIKKGVKVYIEGALQTSKWTSPDGVERMSTNVVLQGFNCAMQVLTRVENTNETSENESSSIEEFVDEQPADDNIVF